MQTSGANTTKRRVRRYWVAAVPIIAMFVPLGGSSAAADPVTDTLCTVRGLLNVLVEPCTQTSPQPQPSAAPTAAPTARPSTRASASPDAPPKARTLFVTTTGTSPDAEAPVQAGTIPPSQSAEPAPSESGDNTEPIASDRSARSPFGIAELLFVALMSAGLAWVLAARRRRRLDTETEAAVSRIERLKLDLVSRLAHELFTPLTPLLGYASMIRSGKLTRAQTRAIAERLIDSSRQLERTIDLLVTFAAVRSGTRTLRLGSVDAAGLARRVASEAKERHPERSIEVTVARSVPALNGDAELIQAAVDQLVDNAIKFSPAGTPVEIGVHAGPPESGTVEFVVTDHGIGIPPADLPGVFESFHQVDGSSTRDFGGVGLGLAFVSAVAEMHGGAVDADSKRGLGSAFTFRIRTATAAHPVPVHPAQPATAIRHTAA